MSVLGAVLLGACVVAVLVALAMRWRRNRKYWAQMGRDIIERIAERDQRYREGSTGDSSTTPDARP